MEQKFIFGEKLEQRSRFTSNHRQAEQAPLEHLRRQAVSHQRIIAIGLYPDPRFLHDARDRVQGDWSVEGDPILEAL